MQNLTPILDDSRWLQLEVCREFQRSKCSRSDTECKFAHPPPNVEVQNGRVIACYDSIKGRCNREKPPCKYFHPPQHLKDQLLINGRNHLALKNALMLQMGMSPGQAVLPGQIPTMASPYLTSVPQLSGAYSPYVSASPMLQVVTSDAGVTSQLGVVSAAGYPAQAAKMQRSDRIEAYPGMVQYKRSAGDKTAMMYQPTAGASAAAMAAAYQQTHALMQLQQPFVPVSCEYSGAAISSASIASSSSSSATTSKTTATLNSALVLTNGSSATTAFESNNSSSSSSSNPVVARSDETESAARKEHEFSATDDTAGPSGSTATSNALKRPHSSTPTPSTTPAYSSAPIPTLYSTTPTSLYYPGSMATQSALAYTGVSLNKQAAALTAAAAAAASAPGSNTQGTHPAAVAAMQQYMNPYALLSAQAQFNPYASLAGNPLLGAFPGVAAAAAAGFPGAVQGQSSAAQLAALQLNNNYAAGLAGLYAAAPSAFSLGGVAPLTNSMVPQYVGLGVPNAAAVMGGMRTVPTGVPNVGVAPSAAAAAAMASAGLQPYKKMRTM